MKLQMPTFTHRFFVDLRKNAFVEIGYRFGQWEHDSLTEFSIEKMQSLPANEHDLAAFPEASRLFESSSATLYQFHGNSRIISPKGPGLRIQYDPIRRHCFISRRVADAGALSQMSLQLKSYAFLRLDISLPYSDEAIAILSDNSVVNLDVESVELCFTDSP